MLRPKKDKMDDDSLDAIIQHRKTGALNYRDGELSSKRENLLARYLGKPYGTERDGQSKVVTRQCLEAVEWTLPSLLRVFMASPTIVEFEPTGAEDEAAAQQETEALNHVFFKKNDGFMTAYTWIKDTLMNPVGYIKVYWDEKTKVTTETYNHLTPQEAEMIMADDNNEVIEQEEVEKLVQTPMGPILAPVFNLKIRRTIKTGFPVIEPVPPEELTIDDKLNRVSLEYADFVCHTTQPTRSEMIQRGFDEDLIYSLPAFAEQYDEARNRHDLAEERGTSLDRMETSDRSTEELEVDEAYLLIDYDGDGVAEFRRVISCANNILENEEADFLPFVGMTAVPTPHVHVGQAWQELVEDLQKIQTTLTRQMLNNLYRTNNPRTVVGRGVNMSDLLNDLPNQPIRAKDINQLRTEPTQSVIGQVLPALDKLDDMGEKRTGVSKSTMGLDTDALSRVTKGAWLGSLEQANQRIEALARIMAESGFKPLFLKLHQLMQMHQEWAFEAKLGGKWASINPSEWRERDNMTVTVGLGTGNKQAQIGALDKVAEYQGALLQNGKENMVGDQNLYNTAAKMIEVTGLHNPDKYFLNPSTQPPKQPQPPPPDANMELVKVEAKKNEMKHMEAMAQLQQDNFKLELQVLEKKEALRLKDRELDIKEGEVVLDSEYKQATLDSANRQELRDALDKFEGEGEDA